MTDDESAGMILMLRYTALCCVKSIIKTDALNHEN